MAVPLPPLVSGAAGSSLAEITAASTQTLPPISEAAQATILVPLSAVIVSTLPGLRTASVEPHGPLLHTITDTVRYDELSAEDRRIVRRALQYSHRVRSRVHIYDGDEIISHDIAVADGQLDVDATADVTRSISLTVVDPDLKFSFGSMGHVYLDNQIGVKYGAEIRELDAWVDFSIFRGPVTGLERKGHEVTIEAQGKESLLLPPVKQYVVPSLVTRNERQRLDFSGFSGTASFRLQLFKRKSVVITRGGNYTTNGIQNAMEDMLGKGQVTVDQGPNDSGFRVTFSGHMGGTSLPKLQVVDRSPSFDVTVTEVTDGLASVDNRHVNDYIRRVVHQYGEFRTNLGSAGNTNIPKTFGIDPSKAQEIGVWPYLQQIADSVDLRLLYDGRGILKLEPYTLNHIDHVFTIDVLSSPTVRLDLSEVRNMVEVYGTDKKGHDVLKAREQLASDHPLSPHSLGRNGVPRILLEQVKIDQNIDAARAHHIAQRKLRQRSLLAVDASFDALPMPYLEEWMTCRVKVAGVDQEFMLKQFSLPLGPASMSVNYNRARPVHKFKSRRLKVPSHHHKHHSKIGTKPR